MAHTQSLPPPPLNAAAWCGLPWSWWYGIRRHPQAHQTWKSLLGLQGNSPAERQSEAGVLSNPLSQVPIFLILLSYFCWILHGAGDPDVREKRGTLPILIEEQQQPVAPLLFTSLGNDNKADAVYPVGWHEHRQEGPTAPGTKSPSHTAPFLFDPSSEFSTLPSSMNNSTSLIIHSYLPRNVPQTLPQLLGHKKTCFMLLPPTHKSSLHRNLSQIHLLIPSSALPTQSLSARPWFLGDPRPSLPAPGNLKKCLP